MHVVMERLDDGPVLAKAWVPVQPGDTPDSLARRVLVEQHRIYPEALARFLETLPDRGKAKGGSG